MKTAVLEKMPPLFWETIREKKWEDYFTEEDCPDCEIVIIRTYTNFNPAFYNKFPRLQLIIRAGTGVDNIDFSEAEKRNVVICHTPEANAISAYEHTISLIFSLIKNIYGSKQILLQGKWRNSLPSNTELSDLRVLIVGVGRVGKRVAKTLQFLGVEVKCVDPYLSNSFWQTHNLISTDYDSGLRWCNLLTFHCPLTRETENYFSVDTLKILPNPIWLINASRGKVVQERAIKKGLDEGKLLGVALDVFTEEPYEAKDWCLFDNVIITPHMGAFTENAKKRMALETLKVWKEFVFNKKITSQAEKKFTYY